MSKNIPIPPMHPKAFPFSANTSDILRESQTTETAIREILLGNVVEEDMDFSYLIFGTVKFVNCRFFNCTFTHAEFVDVIFQSCDFSGCNLSNGYFERVQFQSCKGMGTRFSDSVFKHIKLDNCNFNYANFDNCKLENIKIEQTELNSGSIAQCKCKNVQWEKVNLKNTSFFHTSLGGMDLSDCDIAGLVLSDTNEELKGATVDLYQAAELAKRLGIIIKDANG